MTFWSKTSAAALLTWALALPVKAEETLWTSVIPKGFPGNVYTWHLRPDGSYSEDGRDMATGKPVQPTLAGHWHVTAKHMVLKQDGIAYVFEGDIFGDEYLGVLYLDGKRFARFCAHRGEAPPQNCTDISA